MAGVSRVSAFTTSDFDSVDNTSQKKPELHGQEAPVTPVNALEAQGSDGEGSSQATFEMMMMMMMKSAIGQDATCSKGRGGTGLQLLLLLLHNKRHPVRQFGGMLLAEVGRVQTLTDKTHLLSAWSLTDLEDGSEQAE